ncbi:MAG: class I SAM-dependent methyltransferase, partial [Nanoarchaeota archaeon]
NLQHTAFQRLSTANNSKISKIRGKFFADEDNFYRKNIKNKIVLVAGSGLGNDAIRISKYNKKVVGIDILPKLVSFSEKRRKKLGIKNISFKVGDIKKLKYKNNSFDVAVLNMGTIGNFDNKAEIIKELLRACKEAYIDFYQDSKKSRERRKKMYEEER